MSSAQEEGKEGRGEEGGGEGGGAINKTCMPIYVYTEPQHDKCTRRVGGWIEGAGGSRVDGRSQGCFPIAWLQWLDASSVLIKHVSLWLLREGHGEKRISPVC